MSGFLGSHSINMDAKGRFAVPTRVREELAAVSERIVVTAHNKERCLLVYPESRWQELLPEIEALPNQNPAAANLQRLLIGYATPMDMDSNGRIVLSTTLREYAKLEKKLMLVGLGKRFELWSETEWFAALERNAAAEATEQMNALSL